MTSAAEAEEAGVAEGEGEVDCCCCNCCDARQEEKRAVRIAFSSRRDIHVEIKSRTRPDEQATTAARRGPRVGMRPVVATAEGLAPLVPISTRA